MENIDKTKENKIVESGRLKDYSTTITILEHISDAIFILNPSGKIEYANNIALEMLGLNLEKIVGQNLNNYIVTDLNIKKLNSEDPSDFLLKTIYEGVYNEVETALVNGNHITPVIISFGLVQNGKGQINHIIASAKDISIRKELERELRQQELLNISRDRFKELGELVINMVHNFSQPITSIQLLAEYMQKLIGKEEIDKNALEKNLNNMIKLLNIINASISNLRNIAYAAEDDSLKSIDIIHSIEKLEKQISYD
ncbi:MAG: PAS domain S-box protein, partial [Calditrichaceae bacterium]